MSEREESTHRPSAPFGKVPFEVLINIIASAPLIDCGSIWLNCRLVSRTWKTATEHAFRNHLQNDLGVVIDVSTPYEFWSLSFTADNFSDDGERVIMKAQDIIPAPSWLDAPTETSECEIDILNMWREDAESECHRLPASLIMTRHMIFLRGAYGNDTELPGLESDFDNASISFRWKQMFSMFFGEKEHIDSFIRVHPALSDTVPLERPMTSRMAGIWMHRRMDELAPAAEEISVKVRHMRVSKWLSRDANSRYRDHVMDDKLDAILNARHENVVSWSEGTSRDVEHQGKLEEVFHEDHLMAHRNARGRRISKRFVGSSAPQLTMCTMCPEDKAVPFVYE
ncbi:hypothetical protein GE09DRAFT_767013 [Coniochaeta sp. 2T2.1]|nr:hypothetical protein GE09DRAFT_767013 [Coniochaeta sp. 2T2.1]